MSFQRKSLTIAEEAKLWRLVASFKRHKQALSMMKTAALALPHNDDLQRRYTNAVAHHGSMRIEIADLMGEYEGTLWLIANP